MELVSQITTVLPLLSAISGELSIMEATINMRLAELQQMESGLTAREIEVSKREMLVGTVASQLSKRESEVKAREDNVFEVVQSAQSLATNRLVRIKALEGTVNELAIEKKKRITAESTLKTCLQEKEDLEEKIKQLEIQKVEEETLAIDNQNERACMAVG